MFSNLMRFFLLLRPPKKIKLNKKITIGMAAHGNSQTTAQALAALFDSVTGDYELILVDDKSPDDTLDVFIEAKKKHANTKIFSFRSNLEYCESVNAILSHANGKYVLFLSNDIFVTPAYLRELIQCAKDNPACGVVRGCSNHVDNESKLHNIDIGKARFDSTRDLFLFAEQIAQTHEKILIDDDFLVGDAFLVSRKLLDRIGGIDTSFTGYFGDIDFGIRAKAAGFRVVLNQRAFAYHDAAVNFNYLPEPEKQEKIRRRFVKVAKAFKAFQKKYALGCEDHEGAFTPEELMLAINGANISIEALSDLRYVPMKNYEEHRLP